MSFCQVTQHNHAIHKTVREFQKCKLTAYKSPVVGNKANVVRKTVTSFDPASRPAFSTEVNTNSKSEVNMRARPRAPLISYCHLHPTGPKQGLFPGLVLTAFSTLL